VGTYIKDTLDNDHIVPLWPYEGSAIAPIHGLQHLLHGLEARGRVLTVYQEPIEPKPGEPFGHIWVTEANKGSNNSLTFLQFLFE